MRVYFRFVRDEASYPCAWKMVRERKHQTGASNLSTRSENIATVVSANDTKSTFTRAWAHTMIAPDEYKQKALEETRRGLKLSATWKPKEIYKRDYQTVHTESYTDFNDIKVDHGLQPKSLEKIAAENARAMQRQEAVDNMCHLVRNAYGTVATMLRTFHKKPSDNVSIDEFEKYLKRNDLDKYLDQNERQLVFEYVDEQNNGSVPVRDFLKKVEEREFYGQEHNKDQTKLKDFLEFHIKQKRAEQQKQVENNPEPVSSPERARLEELKKSKGLENEVEKMKKALGMRTFGLDVDLEELDHVVEEVFHKPPTNESHRKYARFLHHSQLNLAAIPFYDYRSREIDRLKSRSALIDQELSREGLREEYETLRSTMVRGSLAVSQSLPSLPTLKGAGSSTSVSNSNNFNNSSGIASVRPSPLANPQHQAHSSRPLSANQLAQLSTAEAIESGPPHMRPPPSPSSHGTYQVAKVQPPRLESLTTSINDQLLQPQQSTSSPTKLVSKFNKRDLTKEQTTKEKSKILVDNIDHHISKGNEFDDLSVGPSVVGGGGSVATGSYLDLLIEQPPPSYDGEEEFQAILSSGASPSKHSTSSIQRKSLSKLVNRSLATQDHVSDFYTAVVHPSQSMGRSKDPSKIMRIERSDLTASLSGMGGGSHGGKRTFADKLASQDASRVGMGVNVKYYDSSSDIYPHGVAEEYGDNNYNNSSNSGMTMSKSMSALSPLRESSVFSNGPHTSWDPDDVYRSVASMQFPPLIYEPSQPVRREVPSMAMQEAAKREYRRQEKFARKQANLDVTKNRLAYESLNAQLREMHRTQSRIEDAIRYKSSIFLGDLQAFRQQPLQRMAKRQNMDLSEKMWSGNFDKQTVGLVQDNRDFSSTYRSDFDSDKLRHSDTLKGPMAQQLATMQSCGAEGRNVSGNDSSFASGFASQDTHSGFQ